MIGQGKGGGAFPVAPSGNAQGPLAGFLNSPMGQQMLGTPPPEAAGNTARQPGTLGMLSQQMRYANQQGQPVPLELMPAATLQPMNTGAPPGSLADLLAQLNKGRRHG